MFWTVISALIFYELVKFIIYVVLVDDSMPEEVLHKFNFRYYVTQKLSKIEKLVGGTEE